MSLTTLLAPYSLNDKLILKNRIAMSPMTRNFADNTFNPTKEMAEYYAKRASVGLIITEGTIIRADGRGYSNTPGIYTEQHIHEWQKVTEKVHAQGGKIFCQIWHVGRVSHPHFLQGELPIGPSATQLKGRINRSNNLYYGASRALSVTEIQDLVESYRQAALNAIQAGFDGVEIHGANGYLIDQFLHFQSNLRQDEYGLTAKNMSRFALEIVDACIEAVSKERVALRLSPATYLNMNEKDDERDQAVFRYLLNAMGEKNIAYVHTGNFDDTVKFTSLDNQTMTEFIREHYRGLVMACGGYTIENAAAGIEKNKFDLISLGRPLIANPDLITKISKEKPLTQYDVNMLNNLD